MVGNRKPHKMEINGNRCILRADIDKKIPTNFTGESTQAISDLLIKNNALERVKFVAS